jgi:hypothetical protein
MQPVQKLLDTPLYFDYLFPQFYSDQKDQESGGNESQES